jgi:predicted DNA-binding transcriptional regulator AlpA
MNMHCFFGRFFRIKEVCERTGLSRTTIWRLEKRGEFPRRIQLSKGRVGFSEADLDRWEAARKVYQSSGGEADHGDRSGLGKDSNL